MECNVSMKKLMILALMATLLVLTVESQSGRYEPSNDHWRTLNILAAREPTEMIFSEMCTGLPDGKALSPAIEAGVVMTFACLENSLQTGDDAVTCVAGTEFTFSKWPGCSAVFGEDGPVKMYIYK